MSYGLPDWPQKANKLRTVRAIRRRIQEETQRLTELAAEYDVPTEGRSVLRVLDDVEWVLEQIPGSSPVYTGQQT